MLTPSQAAVHASFAQLRQKGKSSDGSSRSRRSGRSKHLLAHEPVVVVAETADTGLASQLDLAALHLLETEIVEAELARKARLIVTVEQGLRLARVRPLGEALAPETIVLRGRVELRQIEGDQANVGVADPHVAQRLRRGVGDSNGRDRGGGSGNAAADRRREALGAGLSGARGRHNGARRPLEPGIGPAGHDVAEPPADPAQRPGQAPRSGASDGCQPRGRFVELPAEILDRALRGSADPRSCRSSWSLK